MAIEGLLLINNNDAFITDLGDYVGPLHWISPQYRAGSYFSDYRRKHGNESEFMGLPENAIYRSE